MPPAAICCRHSEIAWSRLNISFLPQTGQNRMHGQPLLTLLFQRPLAVLLDRVVLALAPILSLDPPGLNPALVFHPVQYRVEHPVRPLDAVLGAGFNFLNNRVAVTLTAREQA